ncbi:MAG: hypothetical protein HQL52_00040 [Magnetococcales bacterium]|nr:hypothetical protein [Magnetococcales bacterium]
MDVASQTDPVDDRPAQAAAPESSARQESLTPPQETALIVLSKNLLLPLDDLVAVCNRIFNRDFSRQAIANYLKLQNIADFRDVQFKEANGAQTTRKMFKKCDPGFIYLNVEPLPPVEDGEGVSFLFVGIDRATRWVYMTVFQEKRPEDGIAFLQILKKAAPFRISHVLTENSEAFCQPASAEAPAQTEHPFYQACGRLNIDQRIIDSAPTDESGLALQNERISVLLKEAGIGSRKALYQALDRFEVLYNGEITQSNLGHLTPAQTIEMWKQKKPRLFKKSLYAITTRDIIIIATLWFGTCIFFASLSQG